MTRSMSTTDAAQDADPELAARVRTALAVPDTGPLTVGRPLFGVTAAPVGAVSG